MTEQSPKTTSIDKLKETFSSTDPKTVVIGQYIDGKGIYQGEIGLPEKFGINLPSALLWLAPADLSSEVGEVLSYNDTVKVMPSLKNFHGRNGVDIEDRKRTGIISKGPSYEENLYQYFSSLAKGESPSETGWFIPTPEIAFILHENKSGMPKGTELVTQYDDHASKYWTCREFDSKRAYLVEMAKNSYGEGKIHPAKKNGHGCDVSVYANTRPCAIEFN